AGSHGRVAVCRRTDFKSVLQDAGALNGDTTARTVTLTSPPCLGQTLQKLLLPAPWLRRPMADPVDPLAASPSPQRTGPKTVTLTLDGGLQETVPDPTALSPAEGGARPFGDYELLGEIERGGQGIVYRARERHSGRLVALKMMLGERSSGPADLQRFILEAKATSEIDHPGVVAIHAWGEHEGHPFYTMDFVPGQSLSRLLGKGPLSCDRAVRYLAGIARAVAAAHALGIIHRDL